MKRIVLLALYLMFNSFLLIGAEKKPAKNIFLWSPSKALLMKSLAIGYERVLEPKMNFYSFLEFVNGANAERSYLAFVQDMGVRYIMADEDSEVYLPDFHLVPFASFKYVDVKQGTTEGQKRDSDKFVAYGGGVLLGISFRVRYFSIDLSYGVRSIVNKNYFANIANYTNSIDLAKDDNSFARIDFSIHF